MKPEWVKIWSGKFLFTLVTAGVFGFASWRGILSSEQIHAIILLVVTFYFNKKKETPE